MGVAWSNNQQRWASWNAERLAQCGHVNDPEDAFGSDCGWHAKGCCGNARNMSASVNTESRRKWCWWLFADLVVESKKFAIGGCLLKDDNIFCCSLIDLVEANSQGKADVIALKESIEFVIREADILESDLEICYHSNFLHLWISDKNILNWDLRFQRNLFRNMKAWLKNISLRFCSQLQIQGRDLWCQLKSQNSQRAVTWYS